MAMAKAALERGTGARGLRSVMEKTMMNTMFEMPSDETIKECIVTKEAVEGSMQPELIKEEPVLLPEEAEEPADNGETKEAV